MPILNYTTKIEAKKTVGEIQIILANHGAEAILTEYDENRNVKSVNFKIMVNGNNLSFRLPCEWEKVLVVLKSQKSVPRSLCTDEQALRVAWRIVKNWIEAQMAILETEMVKMEQIFLPYMLTREGVTFYEQIQKHQFLLENKN